MKSRIQEVLNNPKIVHVLKRLSASYMDTKTEVLSVEGSLSVEHILPQQWLNNWPLPDGSKGLATEQLWNASKDDKRADFSRRRNHLLQTFGNLTILTQALNSSVSNSQWSLKKPALLKHSLLPINQQLHETETWDEEAITHRSDDLFARALKVWPRSV